MKEHTSKQVNYFTTRYSLYKEKQLHINDIINPRTKEEAFLDFINRLKTEKRIEILVGGHSYVMYYSETISSTRHLFKFAKQVKRTVNQANISDIEETQIPDYPWCLIIVDTKSQIFLIGRNSQISSNITTQKNYIAKAISSILNTHQVFLQLELITNKNTFWESISENSGDIQFVELTLISPNFLGQSYSTTRLLEELKDECNNDSLTWKFENRQGKLKISSMSKFFKDILEYISNGCGNWKIKMKSISKPIISDDQAIEFPLDGDISALTVSQKENIQNFFTRINDLEKINHGEDADNEEDNS